MTETTDKKIPLSIIAIKSIIARVKEDINMRALTVSIRQYCIEEQQIHNKDKLLTFFLKCENKLRKCTNNQWNRVIDNQIKKMIGLESLDTFMKRKLGKKLMIQLQNMRVVDEQVKIESRILDELGEFGDLQISEDIKIKTRFFFIWCKHIEEKKEIKRMKNKQVQDLKKSKLFNQYSCKFQSFMKWKQHVKKVNAYKEKTKIIQQHCQERLAKAVITQIQQQIQVMSIDEQLAKAVSDRLDKIQLINVFKMLKKNKNNQLKFKQISNRKNNVWLYRFYSFITKPMIPLMSKTASFIRNQVNQEYQQICMKNCWKGFKQQVKQTNLHINKITMLLKSINLRKFIQIKINLKKIKSNSKRIKIQRKKILFNNFIEVIQESSQSELNCINKMKQVNEIIKTNALNNNYIIFKNIKQRSQQLQTKLLALNSYYAEERKHEFITRFATISKNIKQNQIKSAKLRSNYLINFIKLRYIQFKHQKQDLVSLEGELKSQHYKYLHKIAWKSLSLYKRVKANEFETFNSVFSILDCRLKQVGFQALKERRQQSYKLQKLIKSSEYVALKISFITILNRMLSNKIKIKNFYHRQELGLKRKLMEMLKCNSQIIKSNQEQIKILIVKYAKKRLIKHLFSIKDENFKNEKTAILIEKHQKHRFFNKLYFQNSKKLEEQQKIQNVCLLIRCNGWQNYSLNLNSILANRQQQNKKIFKIEKNTVKVLLKRFRKIVKDKQKKRQIEIQQKIIFEDKIIQVKNKLAAKYLVNIIRSTQTTISTKRDMLIHTKYCQFIELLKIDSKYQCLKGYLKQRKANQFVNEMKVKLNIRRKKDKFMGKLNKNRTKNTLITFQDNIICQFEERQQKQNQLQNFLLKNRQIQAKKYLIHHMKQEFQLKENSMILTYQILKKKLNQFVKVYLNNKSQSIKQFVALRHYATNIKRRGFRCMKKAINTTILKQNRVKTQYHSKLSMEKSMDNARKKSKLLQTIERYNLSRVSRAVR